MKKLIFLFLILGFCMVCNAQFTKGLREPDTTEPVPALSLKDQWVSGVSFRSNFNTDDYILGLDYIVTKPSKGLSFIVAFDGRPFKKKILKKEFGNQYFQLAEIRFISSVGVEYHRMFPQSNFGYYVQGNVGYTFGDFGGTKINPDDDFVVIPRAGLLFDRGGLTRIKIGYEYFNAQTPVISGHRFFASITFKFSSYVE